MKTNEYGKYLSEAYDALNGDVDYAAWADFYEACAVRFTGKKPAHICEMACGTGNLSVLLSGRGYHVTAFDLSEPMLTLADKKATDAGVKNLRLTKQDMCHFQVYTPAEQVVCMMDGINCLTGAGDAFCAFESANAALVDGGLFVFDVNTRRKFEHTYADNAYVLEDEHVFLAWQNFYNKKTHFCDLYLTFFFEEADGRYARFDEHMRQRMYPEKTLDKFVKQAGFEIICKTGGFDFENASEQDTDRLFYICKKVSH